MNRDDDHGCAVNLTFLFIVVWLMALTILVLNHIY